MSLDNILLIPGLDWTPRNLFRPGDNGLWQDMSNFGTLRQLSTGSTLVSSVGDPIGHIADSGPRGHLTTQTTNGKRPILSRTPEGGVRNLLDNSNGFAASPWIPVSGGTGVNPVRTANAAVAPDGTMTATRVDFDRGAGNTISDASRLVQAFAAAVNGQHTQSIWMKAAESADIGKQVALRNVGATAYAAVTLTANWVRYTRTETGTTSNFELGSRGTFSVDNQVSALLWEGQLEPGATATANQRVTNRYDITEAGKRDCWAYGTDGIDDAMSTPSSVDMSGSDEMTVCVGVRKFSDAATSAAFEIGNTAVDDGTAALFAPLSTASYSYRTKGTGTVVVSVAGAAAPDSSVILGESKISTPVARIFKDGILANESATSQGAGNYGDHRIYFGARGETSLFFTGLVYQTVIINRLLSDYEKTKLQQFVARKMGITL